MKVQNPLNQSNTYTDQSSALHVADPSSIHNIPYGPWTLSEMIPECRARCVSPKKEAQNTEIKIWSFYIKYLSFLN